MEEQAEYTLDLNLNVSAPARVDELWQMHYQLALNLEHLLYRQFRADLPATFKPDVNRPGADRFLAPLALTREERADLEVEVLATQMQILDLAGEIHKEMFGEVPEWLKAGLLKIKAEREARPQESYETPI